MTTVPRNQPERREEVEHFANEVASGPDDGERDEELAEVELLRQDLLDVLLSVDGKPSVRHHEVNP